MKQNTLYLFLCLLILAGCRSPEYLAEPEDFRYHVKGLYLKAQLGNDARLLGEIIEVNPEEIVLLALDQNIGLRTFPKGQIKTAEVVVSLTSDAHKAIGAWAGLINLLSIGHGGYAILSMPINIPVTTAVANKAAMASYRVKYPDQVSWEEMKKFARFPQGIPEQINREDLK